jgi:opacity protein-like surface antigen
MVLAFPMRKSLQALLLIGASGVALGGAFAAAPAQAQEWGTTPESYANAKGFYATLGLGASWPQNINWDARNLPINGTFKGGGGFSGEVGVGYDFGAIRTELTYGYTNNSLNSVTTNGFGTPGASGSINRNDILASIYLDIPTHSRWTPYIGGGIGYTNVGTPNFNIGSFNSGSANRGLFGYQAKVGVSYAASRSTDLFLEGVYSGASGFSSNNVNYGSLNEWGAKLGVRFRFGGAPKAPVAVTPAPAPAPYVAPAPQPAPYVAPAPQPIRGLW